MSRPSPKHIFVAAAVAMALAWTLAPVDKTTAFEPAYTWRVAPEASTLSFVAVKNGNVPVPGQFRNLRGTVRLGKKPGQIAGKLTVPIDSLDTDNPQRDKSITKTFFEIATAGSTAEFRLQSYDGSPQDLAEPGDSARFDVQGTLHLHGAKVKLTMPLRASMSAEGVVSLTTVKSVPLTFADLGMEKQASALKKVCGHADLLGLATINADLRLTHGAS